MSEDIFSAGNIKKAKMQIAPYVAEFLKVEPGNTMGIADTRPGIALLDEVMKQLVIIGYSPEDSTMLLSDVLTDIHENGYKGPALESAKTAAAPGTALPPRTDKNSF